MYYISRMMKWVLSLAVAMIIIVALPAVGSSPEDSCIEPLDSLLDCLAYAQGKAPSPTVACCASVGRVFEQQKKCLCELMGASFTRGSTGLPPFNQSLALSLPSACRVPADPSECPGLLGIPLSSAEAKEFDDASRNATSTGPRIISSTPSSAGLRSMMTSPTDPSNDAARIRSPTFFFFFFFLPFLLVPINSY